MTSVENVFGQICRDILDVKHSHPVRVAIDGITASGKSTFAKGLVQRLKSSGREILYTTLDGFHNEKKKRHSRGRDSAEGYYWDAYNYGAIVAELLEPLGPNGDLFYRTEVFDLKNDRPLESPKVQASPHSILIVDGSFALRSELSKLWEYKVYLGVDYEIAEKRASIRDRDLFGSSEKAVETTRLRYHGAHRIHMDEVNPKAIANRVIDNNDPLNPKLC